MLQRPQSFTLFPYTTLFRSRYNSGMENETVKVQMNFPLAQVTKPIVWHLAHDFGLVFSIRRANIDVRVGGFTVLELTDRKSTRLNSSHANISYAVFCLKKQQ